MLAMPSALQSKFAERLRNESIPNNLKGQYKKWLQYYLDFCSKYHFPHNNMGTLWGKLIVYLSPRGCHHN